MPCYPRSGVGSSRAGLASALVEGEPELLYRAAETATDGSTRAASAVASAIVAVGDNNPLLGMQFLEHALEGDHLEPEDHAWVSLQLARILIEVGAVEEGLDALHQTASKISPPPVTMSRHPQFHRVPLGSSSLPPILPIMDSSRSSLRRTMRRVGGAPQEVSSGLRMPSREPSRHGPTTRAFDSSA